MTRKLPTSADDNFGISYHHDGLAWNARLPVGSLLSFQRGGDVYFQERAGHAPSLVRKKRFEGEDLSFVRRLNEVAEETQRIFRRIILDHTSRLPFGTPVLALFVSGPCFVTVEASRLTEFDRWVWVSRFGAVREMLYIENILLDGDLRRGKP